MIKTLVTYRTPASPHNQYAVVPNMWLSDLLSWLTLSESATIVSKTDNEDSGAILPINWPSYETCRYCLKVSDLMNLVP